MTQLLTIGERLYENSGTWHSIKDLRGPRLCQDIASKVKTVHSCFYLLKKKKKKPGRGTGGGTLLGRPFGIRRQPILSRSIALARMQGDRKGYQIWVEAGSERAS